jgi:hypothetical protein
MSQIRVAVGAALIVAALAVSAQAQTSSPPSTPATQAREWTLKKWNAAKVELQKNKEKWGACNAKSTEQHLKGRKSWSFIYDCMKS